MTLLSTLVIKIVGDISEYTQSLDKSMQETDAFSARAVDGLSAIGGGIVAGGLAVAGAGIAAMGVGLKNATDAAMEAESIQAQLNAVLASTGGAAGVSADMANELAISLGLMTKFEDDAIVSGENMLLTFTNIGKDVFPDATSIMLDMSQALGQDLKSSAIQLGKALQDPVKGVTALQRVGVTFTDEQKTMIETMAEAGDVAGAQKLILAELSKEFGGSAVAAGNTASGVWERIGNVLGNVSETIGGALLPTITEFGQSMATYLANPETQAFIGQLATQIGAFAGAVITYLPQVLGWFQSAFGWLQANQGVIAAALAVIGSALLAFAYTSLAAAIPTIVAFVAAAWPVVLVIGLIAGAAYVLYEAWTNNWGGIQEKTAEFWAWLQPILQQVWDWLSKSLVEAGQKLSAFWNETLLPAIQAVWGWVQEHLFPLFEALGKLLGVTLFGHGANLADMFKTVLGPVLDALGWSFGNVMKVVEFLAPYIGDYVSWAFGNLTTMIDGVTKAIDWMADALSKISLPDWLTPGSPTPFENGLRGIADAMGGLIDLELPGLRAGLELAPVGVGAVGMSGLQGVKPSAGAAGYAPGAPVQVIYNDNAVVRSGQTTEIVDKLGPALVEFLRSKGLL